MDLPERFPTIPRKKNSKSHKAKFRKQTTKKSTPDLTNEPLTESKLINKLSSDSDTSDTEGASGGDSPIPDWKVRLEAVKLFQNIVLNVSSRDFFSYWTQIVAGGSKMNSRVLTKLILKEHSYKVLQLGLSSLSELLRGARSILVHAEEVECRSFVTFFGTVSSVIKELHYSVTEFLERVRNIPILTQGIKCATALAESTPYHRLKPGLVKRLIRNCRCHTLHKGMQ